MTHKTIEIEYRALLSKEQYKVLIERLLQDGEDLGKDDKSIHFFLLPSKLLKVTDNISKNSAKVTLKLSRIGEGAAFEEIEYPIVRDSVNSAVRVFQSLGFEHMIEPIVKRHNFMYKGVELAVKFSESWQYHVELEIVISDVAQQAEAEEKIKAVAQELELKIMTDEELKAFTQKLEENYRNKN